MNEQLNAFWTRMEEEPRRFFLWLALGSISGVALLVIGGLLLVGHQLSTFLLSVAAFLFVAGVTGFLVGLGGFWLAMIPALKPFFRWVVRRSVFLTACLVTLVALFYAEENWRGRLAWEEFKREASAKGEPVKVPQIIPPPVPDDQNLAAAPLFKELGRELDSNWRREHSGPDGVTNAADRLKLRYLRPNESGPENAFPNWQMGRRTDLPAWQAYYRNPASPKTEIGSTDSSAATAFRARYGLPSAPVSAKPGGDITNEFPTSAIPQAPGLDVLLALSKYDPIVAELREAGERPRCRFPLHYEEGFSMLLSHLSRLRELNQFLVLRAAAELETGQTDKAAADVLLGLRLADAVKDEPLLISHLVRLAQLQLALNPIWEGLVTHRWNDGQLISFEQRLSGIDLLSDYQRAMRGERVLCIWTIDSIGHERRPEMLDLSGLDQPGSRERLFGSMAFQLIPRGWFDQNKATIGRAHLEYILPAVDVAAHRVSPTAVNGMAGNLEQRFLHRSPYNWFGSLLLPALGRASMRSAQGQGAVDLARVAVALERYHLVEGHYPDQLDALLPRFVNQLPRDLINGEPLRYSRNEADSFILYSVGWNEADDGGKTVVTKDGRRADWKEGDWVWHALAN